MSDKEFIELLSPEFQFVLVVAFNSLLVSNSIFLSTKECFE